MASKISTVEKRNKIEIDSNHGVWEQRQAGKSLGYFQLASGGRWKARMIHQCEHVSKGKGKSDTEIISKHITQVIGKAEMKKGDGLKTYKDAIEAADEWFRQIKGTKTQYTVRQCIDDYMEGLEAKKGHAIAAMAKQRLNAHIDSAMGETLVRNLEAAKLSAWRDRMVKNGMEKAKATDEETRRKKQASANRVLSTLKAALNRAHDLDLVGNPVWNKVKPFENVTKRKKDTEDLLTDRQVAAILKETTGAFNNLCRLSVFTGARYGELCKALVRDYDRKNKTLALSTIKGGKRTKEFKSQLGDEAVAFMDELVKDSLPNAYLLVKEDGKQWRKNNHQRLWKAAVKATGQNKNKLDRVRSKAVFYDLRHYHISTALMAGIPINVVADNCGTSIKMIEETYAKSSDEFRQDAYNRLGGMLVNTAQT